MERGLLEIYRFVPPPLLETFDPETIDDVDEFLGWVAKARFMQELEEGIVTRAIVRAFPEWRPPVADRFPPLSQTGGESRK